MNNNKKENSYVRLKEFTLVMLGVLMVVVFVKDEKTRQDIGFYLYVACEAITEYILPFIVGAVPYVVGAAVFFWILSVNNKLDKIIHQTKKSEKYERYGN